MEKSLNKLFDTLDKWRHLPNYQLERRSDIFFSLYLPSVISAKYVTDIEEPIIPEMPLHLRTLDPSIGTNLSYKVDYFCISADKETGYLVELKTELSSRRIVQDEYLEAAEDKGLENILIGLKQIFIATKAKRKYFHLFKMLEELNLVSMPLELHDYINRSNFVGINKIIKGIKIPSIDINLKVVYVQPIDNEVDKEVIDFEYFANYILGLDDPLANRFAYSLMEWAKK